MPIKPTNFEKEFGFGDVDDEGNDEDESGDDDDGDGSQTGDADDFLHSQDLDIELEEDLHDRLFADWYKIRREKSFYSRNR